MRSLLVGVLASFVFAATALAQAERSFVLSVDQEGSYFTDSRLLDDTTVVEQTAAALRRDASVSLVIEADARAPHDRVTHAAQLLQQAGATKIAFRTKTQ